MHNREAAARPVRIRPLFANPRAARARGRGAAAGGDWHVRCTLGKRVGDRDWDGRCRKGTAVVTAIVKHINVFMAGLAAVIFSFWLLLI